jgi:hypothetical protein
MARMCGECSKTRNMYAVTSDNRGYFSKVPSFDKVEDDAKIIPTPFNIEAILRACPKLLEAWKKRPFVLDMTDSGEVRIRHVDLPKQNSEYPKFK